MQKIPDMFFISVLCITLILVMGCTGTQTAPSEPQVANVTVAVTPATATSIPIPKYSIGDLVSPEPGGVISGGNTAAYIILDINTAQDIYTIDTATEPSDGSGTWSRLYPSPTSSSIASVNNWYYIGQTDASKFVTTYSSENAYDLAMGLPTPTPAVTPVGSSLTQYLPVTSPTPSQTITFQGSGNGIQTFTAYGTGTRIFNISYSGSGNFVVWLENAQANHISQLANTVGSFQDKIPEQLGAGTYYLDVTAEGPWTVELTSP
jgi:hypothetical protein